MKCFFCGTTENVYPASVFKESGQLERDLCFRHAESNMPSGSQTNIAGQYYKVITAMTEYRKEKGLEPKP